VSKYFASDDGSAGSGCCDQYSLKVVGPYSDTNGRHAFLWENGQFTELRIPGATCNNDVRQLNNNDQALMFATVDGLAAYYLYSDGNYLRINSPDGYT
jgi:hypothetical protein